MRVYFLSERPALLFVNGLLLGSVDGFERTAELDPKNGCFLECKPLGGFLPARFRFDESFLIDPPPQVELYFLRGGVSILCKEYLREDGAMHVLLQKRLAGTRFTLFVQGRVQLSMENETGFHLVDLPDAFERADIFEAGEHFTIEGEDTFCILSRAGEVLLKERGRVIERGRTVVAETPISDSLGHIAVCGWEGGERVSLSLRARREPTEATFALALFESVLAGADPAPFLADALREKADALKEFLGPFLFVLPCEDPAEVGLGYQRRERVFDIRYFRVEFEGGKIANILES